ncbi:YafY family transcriptional regulator [Paenibacillus sp. JNUCC31]|uniref:helix-turn-helix transcriptional regulator n=1 Tax=Paenibacillus sp. JNUCC-31 TaxID=2777983 RepID=UPI001785A606|nr:YafY family protein [Paenibacillus sp. JNUCC-31]QOS77327.1 YafY family transcriptional regulator [Paenibacillus sp. JNUCC-31]
MKLERLISIIYKLLNHEVLSASRLAEEFQVSQRTIYRDIDAICAAGFPVISFQGHKGGYGMMDGYKMEKSLLGSYDVNSLITVLSSLSTVFEDARAQGTIERLRTVGTQQQTSSLEVDLETHRTTPDALRDLRTAITECKVISFDYINTKNEYTTRFMEPVRLHFKYRNWYVYGFCRSRQDYREFRLSRMIHLSLTEGSFQPHLDVPKEATLSNREWKGEVRDVVFRVSTDALAEALDHFHQADKQFHDDGSMTMRIPVDQPLEARWLCSFLLSLGSGVEVLEPLELREIIQKQLRNALQLYEEV